MLNVRFRSRIRIFCTLVPKVFIYVTNITSSTVIKILFAGYKTIMWSKQLWSSFSKKLNNNNNTIAHIYDDVLLQPTNLKLFHYEASCASHEVH